ncbi:hypothetical protein BH23CHL2_BH23CHL2_32000 [soil metagenome]
MVISAANRKIAEIRVVRHEDSCLSMRNVQHFSIGQRSRVIYTDDFNVVPALYQHGSQTYLDTLIEEKSQVAASVG